MNKNTLFDLIIKEKLPVVAVDGDYVKMSTTDFQKLIDLFYDEGYEDGLTTGSENAKKIFYGEPIHIDQEALGDALYAWRTNTDTTWAQGTPESTPFTVAK